MVATSIDTAIYTDFQGLAGLRAAARENSPEALRQVAGQFEALFMQMMLKSMRDASWQDDLFNSEQGDMYRDMFDQQLAINLSQASGLGLADMLTRQLSGVRAPAAPVDPADSAFRPRIFQGEVKPLSAPVMVQRFISNFATAPAAPQQPSHSAPLGDSPETFVQSLWPHAQQAARALGVAPELLLAQAALETHWGQSIINFQDGRSSHNLFGIKADPSWAGKRINVPTLEYIDGIAVRRTEPFRVYDSYTDSFADYVDFIRNNPRYEAALRQAHNPDAYAAALQGAGYATDPQYARKISAILKGDTLGAALGTLKNH